jgi:hypothetical protein
MATLQLDNIPEELKLDLTAVSRHCDLPNGIVGRLDDSFRGADTNLIPCLLIAGPFSDAAASLHHMLGSREN